MNEPFRPQFHFTPQAHWINDPNGLVYYAGEYHLFYQYHPHSTLWGPMHWGHAVSPDLVNWTHLPIALYPDELGTIFSGSAIIDWHNTAGFGAEAMVAVFTHHLEAEHRQSQSIAYSTDKGRSWTKYPNNPVIVTPPGQRDFRDPKVFWFQKKDGGGHWVMLLAVGDSIWFYTSPNLIDWTYTSQFGQGQGNHAGVWETPDLFELTIDDSSETRWVLTLGVGAGATVDEQGTQYFVGHFDGTTFTNANNPDVRLRADMGFDFYAAQGWNEAPNQQRLWIAWMSNWVYARDMPTSTWRGAMSLPRYLGLVQTPDGLRLKQQPVSALNQLRGEDWHWSTIQVKPGDNLLADLQLERAEIMAEFQLKANGSPDKFGFHLRMGEQCERTTLAYQVDSQTLSLDRTLSGQISFNPEFAHLLNVPLAPINDVIQLHIFMDHSSIEVFANNGLATITERIFPAAQSLGLALFVEGAAVRLKSLDIYRL